MNTVMAHARVFDQAFQKVGEVVLEQTDAHLIARLNDLVLGEEGRLYLVDGSEGNVKIYGPDGSLQQVLGRKGEGPGEFAQPWRVAVDSNSTVHVVDLGLNRILVFNASGQLVRTVILSGVTGVHDMALLPRQEGYALVTRWSESEDAVVLVDTAGSPIKTFPPSRTITAGGAEDGSVWDFPRVFSLSRKDGNLIAAASVSNRIWSIDLNDGSIDSTEVVFDGYDPPLLPPDDHESWNSGQGMMQWFLQKHLNGYVFTYDGGVLWPFVEGEYLPGDGKITLLHRSDRSGNWEALTDVPVLLTARGSRIAGVDVSRPDSVVVKFFQPSHVPQD